jgi:thioredoxin reductase
VQSYFYHRDAKMSDNASHIAILLRHKEFRFMPGYHVENLSGAEFLAEIGVVNLATSEQKRLKADAIFVYRGIVPDIKIDAVQQDRKGFFLVDENFMTTLPGAFATGRVVYADLPIHVLIVLRQGSNGVILRRNLLCLQGVTL